VLADSNASSKYVRFLAVSQADLLDFDDIFAMDWRHPDDQIAQWRHAARKCAEVLVPGTVEPRFLKGAYVLDQTVAARLVEAGFQLPIAIDRDLFFQ
jgi:RES domain-containing protein